MKSVASKNFADGIRTRVTGLKGQRPGPLDDGDKRHKALFARNASGRKSRRARPVLGRLDRYLSLVEVGERLGCSDRKAKQLILEGPLLGSYVGKRLRVWTADLQAYEREHRKREAISLLDKRPARRSRAR